MSENVASDELMTLLVLNNWANGGVALHFNKAFLVMKNNSPEFISWQNNL